MNPAEILKKPYARMVLPDSNGTFSAEIVEFSGCIAIGNTAAEALENIDSVAIDWIAAALAQGQDIPDPLDSAGYSGKLVVRMPKGLHKRAALYAERDGSSLNQFIITCIAEQVGERARFARCGDSGAEHDQGASQHPRGHRIDPGELSRACSQGDVANGSSRNGDS